MVEPEEVKRSAGIGELPFLVGTMIEVPRACLVAGDVELPAKTALDGSWVAEKLGRKV